MSSKLVTWRNQALVPLHVLIFVVEPSEDGSEGSEKRVLLEHWRIKLTPLEPRYDFSFLSLLFISRQRSTSIDSVATSSPVSISGPYNKVMTRNLLFCVKFRLFSSHQRRGTENFISPLPIELFITVYQANRVSQVGLLPLQPTLLLEKMRLRVSETQQPSTSVSLCSPALYIATFA